MNPKTISQSLLHFIQSRNVKRSIFSAFIMLMVTLLWSQGKGSFSFDNYMLDWQSLVYHSVIKEGKDRREAAINEVVFVSVSKDKTCFQPQGASSSILITDRRKLNSFFREIRGIDYRWLLCDIIFDLPTSIDNEFENTIKGLKNAVFCSDTESNNVIAIPFGASTDYEYLSHKNDRLSDKVLKFNAIDGKGVKTIPLVLYEQEYQDELYGGYFLLSKTKRQVGPENQILDPCILQDDIKVINDKVNFYYLSQLLAIPHTELTYILKDKRIVIGDFENDIVSTAYGDFPGPMLLYNLFLNIRDSRNSMRFSTLLFLFTSFFLVSYFHFKDINRAKESTETKRVYTIIKDFLNVSTELILLVTASSLSYVLFNYRFEVIIVLIWLYFYRYLIMRAL